MEIKGRTAVEDQKQPPPSSPDTTLTKVFVGGLAWETQRDALRDHFHKFGDIIEAVIITDKLTGRSKGYGFVTFKEGEAAKKACEDAAPVINGRKANCNLASLGARRGVAGKISPPATPAPISPYAGGAGCGGATNTAAARPPAAPIPWYFPAGAPASTATMSPFHQHYPAGVPPFYAPAYGYSPSYATSTNMGYRTKINHSSNGGGAYLPVAGQFSYPAQVGMVAPMTITPVYHPMYQFHNYHHNHRLPHSMGGFGIPTAHFFHSVTAGGSGAVPVTHTSNIPSVPAAAATNHARLASAEAF